MFTAQEFGKHGITVNAYSPGVIDTHLSQFVLLLKVLLILTYVNVPTVDPLKATDGTSPLTLDAVSTPKNCAISFNGSEVLGCCEHTSSAPWNTRGRCRSRVLSCI